jgi:AraC-like DNA-binding protein
VAFGGVSEPMFLIHRASLSWVTHALQSERLSLNQSVDPYVAEHVPFFDGCAAFAAGGSLSSHYLYGARLLEAAAHEDISPLALFASTAQTVQAGLSALAWAFPLLTNAAEVTLQTGERPRLTMTFFQGNDAGPWLSEALLACLGGQVRRALNDSELLMGITLAHAETVAESGSQRVFGVTPGKAQHSYSLELSRELLDAPLPRASREIHDYLRSQLAQRIALLTQTGDLVARLRFLLNGQEQLSADCLVEASRGLGVSPRTLQRKLNELGTTFSEELEKSRRERAYRWVLETELPLRTIAKRIGFSDPACFSRAFRRWYHRSPASFRRQA